MNRYRTAAWLLVLLLIPLHAVTGRPERIADRWIFHDSGYTVALDLRNLSCFLLEEASGARTVISRAAFRSTAYRINADLSEVAYPALGIQVTLGVESGTLVLSIASRRPQTVTWPSVRMQRESTALIWPRFEGNYIPLSDAVWAEHLSSSEWNTTESLYLPFWGIQRAGQLLSYLFENPFHNAVTFRRKGDALQMDFAHTFPDNADLSEPITFRVFLDRDASPIAPARHFRRWLEDRGALVRLKDKMQTAPLLARLIGASHAYLWGGAPLTGADVKPNAWVPLAQAILTQAALPGPSAGKQILDALSPERESFEEVSRHRQASAPDPYLQRQMARCLSAALRSSRLYSPAVWPLAALPSPLRRIAESLLQGRQVPEGERVQLNSRLLQASFPEYLEEPSTWGNGVSTRLLDALAQSGMERFLLTCNDAAEVEVRPQVASAALEMGYLLGPYDEYSGVHDPEAPEWSTSVHDRALYETGGILRADGTAVKGFLGVGYSVSPIAVRPYFQERVARNFQRAPYSYYFLDGDAFGEFHDDYRPGRIVSQSQDAAARAERGRWVFQTYKVPVGSEGGSHLCASWLAVAEGVFMPNLWGDEDMRTRELSRYFLGQPFPPEEPERFFLPVPLKDRYARLYSDPRFRLPLYEAVFHDSVISTSHYSSGSLKFSNIAQTTALTEILYQVAPMYHFNLRHFQRIQSAIQPHAELFARTHAYSWQFPLQEFAFLSDDRNVQRTRFGNLELIANFSAADFRLEASSVPARSLLVRWADSGESSIYRPAAPESPDTTPPAGTSVPGLIALLRDEEWQVRVEAAKALANLEGQPVQAVPALTKALRDEEWQVRRAAAYALATLGKKAKAAVPLLVAALADEEWQVRRPAALALGAMGRKAHSAIPELEARLQDPELRVRLAAEEALQAIRKCSLRK